ncbi:MAG: hypothetical protein R6T93_08920 [Trueperaceae bacterium]
MATLPGTAAPAVAHRTYRGPQGHYLEHVALLGPDGAERYRSPRRPMVLEGESITTDVATEITGIELDSAEEHALVCYVDKAEVGRVPVFVETPDGGDPRLATKHTLAQALKKSTILWVTIPQTDKRGRPAKPVHRPVWFVADGTTVYVLSGPGEQELPGIDEVSEVTLSARGKDAQSQIAEIACAVEAVDVDDPRYARFESQALTRRLNLTDGDGAAQRWRQTCRLYALTPQLGLPEEPEKAAAGGGKARKIADDTPAKGDNHIISLNFLVQQPLDHALEMRPGFGRFPRRQRHRDRGNAGTFQPLAQGIQMQPGHGLVRHDRHAGSVQQRPDQRPGPCQQPRTDMNVIGAAFQPDMNDFSHLASSRTSRRVASTASTCPAVSSIE